MSEIDALLKRATELVNFGRIIEDKTYMQPCRSQFCFEFLDHVVVHKQNFLLMEHWWLDSLVIPHTWFIMHGHKVDHSCGAPCFCHRFGYWPNAEHNPKFIKQFNIKWRKIYQERGWKINE